MRVVVSGSSCLVLLNCTNVPALCPAGSAESPIVEEGCKAMPLAMLIHWVSLNLCVEQHAVCFGISSPSTLHSSLHKQYHAAALAQHLIFPFFARGKTN